MFQHARYHIPDRNHGYCLDDNARAILVLIQHRKRVGKNPKADKFMRIYLSFLDYAFNQERKKFRNFMSYDRNWLEEEGSEDSQGRALWAIATMAADQNFREYHPFLDKLLKDSIKIPINSPNALAFSLLGLTEFDSDKIFSGISIKEQVEIRTKRLIEFFKTDNPDWPWSHPFVTYDGCRIPQAIMKAGNFLNDNSVQEKGKELLDWLIDHQFEDGIFVPIGNHKWMSLEGKSKFDQQPLEASAMIDACVTAAKILRDSAYLAYAQKAFNWFLGENLIGKPLYDPKTGGCCDGLHSQGVNGNQGAESTLAWLSSALRMMLHKKIENPEIKRFIHENS